MLKKTTFIGTNHFLSCGIMHMVRSLQHHIPNKYSATIFIDLSSCHHHVGEALVTDNNALVILLMDDEKDSRLFQMPEELYHTVYLVANSTYSKLCSDLKNVFINSDKFSCSIYKEKYKILFSRREEMIIELIMDSYSLRSISSILKLPIKKIYNSRASVLRKLNVNNVVGMYNKIQQINSVNYFLNSKLATKSVISKY